MKAIWYGHSTFAVEIQGKTILFDPFISANPVAQEVGISLEDVRADYILVSHGHEDHIADVLELANRTNALVVSNFEIINWLSARGLKNAHAMNLGGSWKFPFGRVTMTIAAHSSSLPDGSYGGMPAGFIVESAEGNFYYSGDTALLLEMELIGRHYQLDWAALCIGDNFTMGVKDAIEASKMLRVKDVLGVHYDTFPFIKINRNQAVLEFAEAGVSLYLPTQGSLISLPGRN